MLHVVLYVFTSEELETVAKKTKKGKRKWRRLNPPELQKCQPILGVLLPALNNIHPAENTLVDWLKSQIVTVYKSLTAPIPEPRNYRGIALMSQVAKLFNKLLLNRFRPHLDHQLREDKNGFWVGRSAT